MNHPINNFKVKKSSSISFNAFRWLFLGLFCLSPFLGTAQHSVARQWNEVLLEGIRNDFARPTVHARNLFHVSSIMYDAWAAYEKDADTYLLGKTVDGYTFPYTGVPEVTDTKEAQEIAMSYAAYRLLRYRFQNSPGASETIPLLIDLMNDLGLDPNYISINYAFEGPAALGNYLGLQMINFGKQDGANELNDYENQYYSPVNPNMAPEIPGNSLISNPNRWQPLSLSVFIDQGGNPIPGGSVPFLSPEWGDVVPFALEESDKTVYSRFGQDYQVYRDCGDPPYIDVNTAQGNTAEYQWGFSLVSIWSSHLDPSDTTRWDISPASIGNVQSYPTDIPGLQAFYNTLDGGDTGTGHDLNPVTGQPYQAQNVLRSDYTRVLAEFWADGPDSETPPGHWFTILNYVNDNPLLEKRWEGAGPIIDDLEWDIKAYFTLGGAVHDAAVVAWSNKGWYDYLRPVSAIRYMADRGQSTNAALPSYNPLGIPLVPGKIELVFTGDPLAGVADENVGKIKVKAWRGPDYIIDPTIDVAGVDWILAENWWPYQRPTFVTPPFEGYVSGHSTFSRAAAEVLTAITGDPFFPGGMGEFDAPAGNFLVFENGPAESITLQWATYRDASDQCSLSRIWGGIHPPADDIPGRLAGIEIGEDAFSKAEALFDTAGIPELVTLSASLNTITDIHEGTGKFALTLEFEERMDPAFAPNIYFTTENPVPSTLNANSDSSIWLNDYTFLAVYDVINSDEELYNITTNVTGARNNQGNEMDTLRSPQLFNVNTKDAEVKLLSPNEVLLNDLTASTGTLEISISFDQEMKLNVFPFVTFPVEDPASNLEELSSAWLNDSTYVARFEVKDLGEVLMDIDVQVEGARTSIDNHQVSFIQADVFSIDTKNAGMVKAGPQSNLLSDPDVGLVAMQVLIEYDKMMDTLIQPTLSFPSTDISQSLSFDPTLSSWSDLFTYNAYYDLADANETLTDIDILIAGAIDSSGNMAIDSTLAGILSIDTENPSVTTIMTSVFEIQKEEIGENKFGITITFDEDMDDQIIPSINFPVEDPLAEVLVPNVSNSAWVDAQSYEFRYDVNNVLQTLPDVDLLIENANDKAGNLMTFFAEADAFDIDITDTLGVGFETLSPEASHLSIQPNPIQLGEQFWISLADTENQVQVELINVQGQITYSQIWDRPNKEEKLAIPTIQAQSGLYLIRLIGQDKSWIQKVLILD